MDLSTLVGTILVLVMVFWAMAMGSGGLGLFWDVPSAVLVFGGTLAVILMNFTFGDMKSLMKVMLRSYSVKLRTPEQEIERLLEYATVARKEGLLALESKVNEIDDRFLAKGLQCLIDGLPPETVRSILQMEADVQRSRHAHGKKILEMFASFAPAFGMIGTLVGLVQMLSSLKDPSQIGGGMAVALLTTLYGALIANTVCLPLAGKLDLRAKQEAQLRLLMIDGLLGIQAGERPAILRERLEAFVRPQARTRAAA
ncbi:MAG: MotA/TolQ/ExbB proton channel family protein [Planctomycetes bacterium]|nr:MotA/TolQ/ExbB proton channel family protein [Planctomycetota bacterium]